MATLTIAVTEEKIQAGERMRSDCCPVALAAWEALTSRYEKICTVSVDDRGLAYRIVDRAEHYFAVDLPQEVSDRIKNYDRTGVMEPFSFEIKLPA